MSAIRSPMPSFRVICQRADRLRRSSASNLASFQPGDHGGCSFRVLQCRQLRPQGQAEVVSDGEEVLADGAALDPFGFPDDFVPEVADQAREAGLRR